VREGSSPKGAGGPHSSGRSAIKPLECVGTVDEARQSLLLAAERHAAQPPPPPQREATGGDAAASAAAVAGFRVAALRTDAERERLPRNVERLLAELRTIGVAVAPGSLERLRGAHVQDLNAEHNIPGWLLPPPPPGSPVGSDSCEES
jgi:hypothetical protein